MLIFWEDGGEILKMSDLDEMTSMYYLFTLFCCKPYVFRLMRMFIQGIKGGPTDCKQATNMMAHVITAGFMV